MSEINLSSFSENLTSIYRRYLFTTNLVADSEPELKAAIWAALCQQDIFCREPLVTCIPAYTPAVTAADLIGRPNKPTLHPLLRGVAPDVFDLAKPLYEHQLDSLKRIQQGRNIIVATGTGSGKTECFLLPILDDAARNQGSGIRAIIVYPMNALANDQLDRMRRLLKNVPSITFGRYTGDTPESRGGLSLEELGEIGGNERFSREEIRSNPPHILLTNFAMMEYLLLRPVDADLFQQQKLRFVVLDEAHTYNGAQGIDVSLLMRRLQETFRGRKLQYILTSATLVADETSKARRRVSEFGRALTGAAFETGDVILGSNVSGFEENCQQVSLEQVEATVPDEESFLAWLKALDDWTALERLLAQSKLPNANQASRQPGITAALHCLFKNWHQARQLHQEISSGSQTLKQLAARIWRRDDKGGLRAIQWLLILASHARANIDAPPLIPARFHFFFRGLNGASICLNPECEAHSEHASTGWSKVFLEDRARCESSCESLLMPLLTCVHCGMPAVSLFTRTDGTWQALQPSEEGNFNQTYLTWDRSLSEQEEDSDEMQLVEVCVSCGTFSQSGNLQCCGRPKVRLAKLVSNQNGEVKTCPRCGGTSRPFPSVLRGFRSGEDAATAVLGEEIVRNLPADGLSEKSLPAGGRRLLAFSDSRQRAAFFAPYLKRTAAESEYAKPLYEALLLAEKANDNEPVSLKAVADRFLKEALKRSWVCLRTYDASLDVVSYKIKATRELLQADKSELKKQAYMALLQNFCASPRQRRTMQGLGIASVEVELTEANKDELRVRLPEIFSDDDGLGFDFIQQLLQIFLIRQALYFEDDSISLQDIFEGPKESTFHYVFNDAVQGRKRNRWNPYAVDQPRNRTILTSYPATVVGRFWGLDLLNDRQSMDDWLRKTWDSLRDTVLTQTGHGGEFKVDADRLLVSTRKPWRACTRCGRLTTLNLRGLCAVPGCEGAVEALSQSDLEQRFAQHHYRFRFTKSQPMALEVKEHTAQLTNTCGREYQAQFIKGNVNVLSSSTTFEMGVDVGQLKAVLLRNVPPTASNYIQRAGRAGRRRDGAAYAVTYSRATPHDQFHFYNPDAIVQGRIPVPLINLKNSRLAQRHVNSLLLGRYLRYAEQRGQTRIKTVADFFLLPDKAASVVSRFEGFLQDKRAILLEAIGQILPSESNLQPEECLLRSTRELFSDDPASVFRKDVEAPLAAYATQLQDLIERGRQTSGAELGAIASAQESVKRLMAQLEKEQLIDFLAGAHWLPGYAFPQDVIRLVVRQRNWSDRMRLERDRERGISEYAPGSEVIADGRLFKSRGVLRRGSEFEVRKYRYCPECRRFETRARGETLDPVCQCGQQTPRGMPRDYILPDGFQTFFKDEVPEPNLYRRRPPYNSELFLVAGTESEAFKEHAGVKGVTFGYRRDGRLFRANPGLRYQKYRLCSKCGAHFEGQGAAPRSHETPWGTECRGTLFRTDLAHEFETDTLQLRFDLLAPPIVSDKEFWLSFQTAFVTASAEVLSIPLADLDGTYRSQSRTSLQGELIIYDRVPGGAGYVELILQRLRDILQRVLERTKTCDNPLCDAEGSCYACLRSYGNQFVWDQLKRRKVFEWLESKRSIWSSSAAPSQAAPSPDSPVGSIDPACNEFLRKCSAVGISMPDVGFELVDGQGEVCGSAEMAWESMRIAVLLPKEQQFEETFKRQGWSIVLSDELASKGQELLMRLRQSE